MSMKFSVLLPTRERLDLLKYAVTSVQKQDYDNWEIVISDNDSQTCDIKSYVASLADPRIQYFRTERLLPVTENWNRALDKSKGDYVIMLGDDDCLLKGYFTDLAALIAKYRQPELIYTSAYIFGYPGVVPGHPDGFLQADLNRLHQQPSDYILPHEDAVKLCKMAMNFKMNYAFNMQYSLVSRQFIERLRDKGPFYQSPYPDFYATNAMFLTARSIVVVPKPMVAIGISPKSYGFYHFNRKEAEGVQFLQNEGESESRRFLEKIILPGSRNNTSWLLAMEAIKDNFKEDVPDLEVGYRRYRLFQALYAYKNFLVTKTLSRAEYDQICTGLTLWEKVLWGIPAGIAFRILGLMPPDIKENLFKSLRKLFGKYEFEGKISEKRRFENILDVFNHV